MGVFEKVGIDESFKITGKAPIAVRWVDVNKGESIHPRYRSRLVAKEFNTGVNHDLYAATPPSDSLRLMLTMLASSWSKDTTLMYADVSRACPMKIWSRETRANAGNRKRLCTPRGTQL